MFFFHRITYFLFFSRDIGHQLRVWIQSIIHSLKQYHYFQGINYYLISLLKILQIGILTLSHPLDVNYVLEQGQGHGYLS